MVKRALSDEPLPVVAISVEQVSIIELPAFSLILSHFIFRHSVSGFGLPDYEGFVELIETPALDGFRSDSVPLSDDMSGIEGRDLPFPCFGV